MTHGLEHPLRQQFILPGATSSGQVEAEGKESYDSQPNSFAAIPPALTI